MSYEREVCRYQQTLIPRLRKDFRYGRRASDVTWLELERAVGVSQGSLRAFEQGGSVLKSNSLVTVAKLVDEWKSGRRGEVLDRIVEQRIDDLKDGASVAPFSEVPDTEDELLVGV